MAEITASMVKALREATGQGMMECKKALQEANGDVEAAKDLLRARGQIKAEKKSTRAASEGLVEIIAEGGAATMVEVSCETDFCARNDEFKAMVGEVAQMATSQPAGEIAATDEITARVQASFEKIGENMKYVRGIKIEGACVGSYKHHNNKVGAVIAVDKEMDTTVLGELCMHIAFHNPMGISADDISEEVMAKEKEIAVAQAVEQGKPKEIAEKMVEGKMRKFKQQNCMLEQPFIRDETKAVKEVLGDAKILGHARFEVGQAAGEAAE